MALFMDLTNNALGDIVIHLKGTLDYISSVKLRNRLGDITKKHSAAMITLNMDSLEFVGSSGIGHFIETVNQINQNKITILLTNVKQEFIKTFKVFEVLEFDRVVTEASKTKKIRPRMVA